MFIYTLNPSLVLHNELLWHGGDQLLTLLMCHCSSGCFDSCLQLVCVWGQVFLISV